LHGGKDQSQSSSPLPSRHVCPVADSLGEQGEKFHVWCMPCRACMFVKCMYLSSILDCIACYMSTCVFPTRTPVFHLAANPSQAHLAWHHLALGPLFR
jgi:hypothetical protein